jgi:rhodanese-related sulfurtransferase
LSLNDFLKKSKESNGIILDTRSDKLYESRHLASAKHLNFSDFTQANLAQLVPNKNTIVLIYLNLKHKKMGLDFLAHL